MKRLVLLLLAICGVLLIAWLGFVWYADGKDPYLPAEKPPTREAVKPLNRSDSDPIKGPRDARVTIDIMSSFACPACRDTARQMDQLLALYPDDLALRWYDVPNSADAYQAAIAARCAQLQGKFWQYHDLLFAKQDFLGSRSLYTAWANELGFLIDRFDSCVDRQETKPWVDASLNYALQYGASVVPHVIIQNEVYEGPQSISVYREALERTLQNKK